MTAIVPEHWQEKSLLEQLANIGSEVHRAIGWQQRDDEVAAHHAWDRALDLFDATIILQRHRPGLRELTRLREVCAGIMMKEKSFISITNEDLDRYFFSFAMQAGEK